MESESSQPKTRPCYFSAKAYKRFGYSIYRLIDGQEVQVTNVGGPSSWDDEKYIGETSGADGFIKSYHTNCDTDFYKIKHSERFVGR